MSAGAKKHYVRSSPCGDGSTRFRRSSAIASRQRVKPARSSNRPTGIENRREIVVEFSSVFCRLSTTNREKRADKREAKREAERQRSFEEDLVFRRAHPLWSRLPMPRSLREADRMRRDAVLRSLESIERNTQVDLFERLIEKHVEIAGSSSTFVDRRVGKRAVVSMVAFAYLRLRLRICNRIRTST